MRVPFLIRSLCEMRISEYYPHIGQNNSEGTMWKRFVVASVIFSLLTGCSVDLAPSWVTDLFTSGFVNYILLFVGLIIVSLAMEALKNNTGALLLCLIGFLGLLLTGVFYWRMGNQMIGQPEKEIFAMGFGIGFAHAVVSLFVLFFLWIMLILAIRIIGWAAGYLLGFMAGIIDLIFKSDSTRLLNFATGCLGNLFVLVLFGGIPYGYYLLMIGTIDLQIFLFGAYDPHLGLNYPTTFTFITLMSQLQLQWELLTTDPILGVYIIPFGVLIAVALKIGGLIDVAQKIRGWFRKGASADQV